MVLMFVLSIMFLRLFLVVKWFCNFEVRVRGCFIEGLLIECVFIIVLFSFFKF